MNRRAFTLVEIIIVVIIIGLLSAMLIPAFQKVRRDSIIKAVQVHGLSSLTPDQKEMYREWVKDGTVETYWKQNKRPTPTVAATPVEETTTNIITDSTDGKRYYLIPRSKAKEATIAGESYFLVPVYP